MVVKRVFCQCHPYCATVLVKALLHPDVIGPQTVNRRDDGSDSKLVGVT